MQNYDKNHLLEIIKTLIDFKVEFIVCGGVALVLHGIERMTMDIDIALDMDEGNLKKFLKAIDILGLVPRVPVPAESIIDSEARRIMVYEKNAIVFSFIDINQPFRQVDVFLAEQLSYDSLKDDIETIKVDDFDVKLVSSKGLLKMKKMINPLRDKDVFDISALEKLIAEKEE